MAISTQTSGIPKKINLFISYNQHSLNKLTNIPALITIPLIISALLAALATAQAEVSQFTYEGIIADIGADGSIRIIEVLKPSNAPVNLTLKLLGEPVFIRASQTGIPLPIQIQDSTVNIQVYSLEEVTLEYYIIDATVKENETWIASLNTPAQTMLKLPDNAVPLSITPQPNIRLTNGSIYLIFPPGEIKVAYILPPTEAKQPEPIHPTQHYTGATPTTTGSLQHASYTETTPTTANRKPTPIYALVLVSLAAGIIAAIFTYRTRKGIDLNIEASMELDERDREIIEALRSGPKTAGELINTTGIPKTPLFRRLNKLVKLGLVGYKQAGNARVYYLIREPD